MSNPACGCSIGSDRSWVLLLCAPPFSLSHLPYLLGIEECAWRVVGERLEGVRESAQRLDDRGDIVAGLHRAAHAPASQPVERHGEHVLGRVALAVAGQGSQQ